MKSMKGPLKNQTGFTLIELMISLLVLSLIIAGYVGTNIKVQQNAEEMHERTVAIQDANRVIEQMRNTANITPFPKSVTDAYPPTAPVPGINNLAGEVITVTYAGSTTDNPLVATITVTWTSYAGRTHTEAVQTYITRRGG